MTSRQPGVTPPGIAGHAEAPGESGEPGHAAEPDGGERADGERAGTGLTAQDWLVRLLPVALLIVVGLAGLRGAVGTLHWDGPLHQDAAVVGVALEVVIVTLFVILLVRNGRGSQEPTAVKLRGVLFLVLGAGAIGAAVLMLAALNLKGLGSARRLPPIRHPTALPSLSFRPHPRPWHTAVLGAGLTAYLLVVHLAESDAPLASLRPQARVLGLGAALLALGAGAGMLPAAGPGAGSALRGWWRRERSSPRPASSSPTSRGMYNRRQGTTQRRAGPDG
jgi:hypothetical protein